MAADLRCNLPDAIMVKLDDLQGHLGYSKRGDTVAAIIVEAHARHLSPTAWENQQAHALKVLRRLKPGLLLAAEEVVGVSFMDGGDRVCIHVALNTAPYQVSRREWEK
jgi:hypothetical protein